MKWGEAEAKRLQVALLNGAPAFRIAGNGVTMILNPLQQNAIASGEPVPLTVAGTECILVRKDIYLLMNPDFDAGSWTAEEIDLLANEAEELISKREAHAH